MRKSKYHRDLRSCQLSGLRQTKINYMYGKYRDCVGAIAANSSRWQYEDYIQGDKIERSIDGC